MYVCLFVCVGVHVCVFVTSCMCILVPRPRREKVLSLPRGLGTRLIINAYLYHFSSVMLALQHPFVATVHFLALQLNCSKILQV